MIFNENHSATPASREIFRFFRVLPEPGFPPVLRQPRLIFLKSLPAEWRLPPSIQNKKAPRKTGEP
ncbi:MAG: hypothetical protein EGS44_11090 [Akkermansia muciniphila]|nr:hypothetical protein [Akkermansia muciniphila]PNC29230.1 hypothetical protein CXU17_08905 [Akkermansia muciniphila]